MRPTFIFQCRHRCVRVFTYWRKDEKQRSIQGKNVDKKLFFMIIFPLGTLLSGIFLPTSTAAYHDDKYAAEKIKSIFGTIGSAGHYAYRRNNQTLVTQPLFDDF